jgi:GNAT superfamily N-acetyltransferase
VLIRAARSADVAAISELVEQYWAFESIAGFDRSRVESLLQGLLADPKRGAIWVAQSGQLCAYLLAVYAFSLEHGGLMAEIDELFVSQGSRSAGVGSLLINQAMRDMSAMGLARIQLQLGLANHLGRAFYERCGFGRREGYELLDRAL